MELAAVVVPLVTVFGSCESRDVSVRNSTGPGHPWCHRRSCVVTDCRKRPLFRETRKQLPRLDMVYSGRQKLAEKPGGVRGKIRDRTSAAWTQRHVASPGHLVSSIALEAPSVFCCINRSLRITVPHTIVRCRETSTPKLCQGA
ncbi:hypothetical protein HDK90DRAFT_201823 [Phyllosticta capitalensis]|uniref:Secreted protein n=1 Tax=Phyllosticta capitalensis TaxID=121624 RepID=A0ABR1YRT9_9PEZI